MMTHNYGFSFKYLPVDRLIELLQTLPKGTVVSTNDIGNLAAFLSRDEKEETFDQVAWIDFSRQGSIVEI